MLARNGRCHRIRTITLLIGLISGVSLGLLDPEQSLSAAAKQLHDRRPEVLPAGAVQPEAYAVVGVEEQVAGLLGEEFQLGRRVRLQRERNVTRSNISLDTLVTRLCTYIEFLQVAVCVRYSYGT